MSKKLIRPKDKSKQTCYTIREVYSDNFVEEIKNLSELLEVYNVVAMDTEFPGVVYQSVVNTRETYYRTIKANVDKLKLIQVGITISDKEGNYPAEVCTWQFNLKFDLNTDHHSNESIAMLSNSGINFQTLESRGIPHDMFGEYLMISGLVLNEDIEWISFHGIYDFAYFLKIVTNQILPETEMAFFEMLKIYFQNYWDIRFLIRFNDNLRGSLSKLGQELNVVRVGLQHQAGSDSLITSEIFFKLKREYLSDDTVRNDKNILFGIGPGAEDNDGNYQNNNQNPTFKFNSNGSNSGYNYDYSNIIQQNMLSMQNMQYNYLRNNTYFQNIPSYFPYNNYNQMNLQYPLNTNMANSNNLSEETKKKYNLKGNVED
jgi:CCR4-NOT transcription complex subunit 7/8